MKAYLENAFRSEQLKKELSIRLLNSILFIIIMTLRVCKSQLERSTVRKMGKTLLRLREFI